VLLEDWRDEFAARPSEGCFRVARVEEYLPNQVRLTVPDGSAGWLVLTDVWYPGWTCRVDGHEEKIHRANYLFRSVWLPAGGHEVVFRFEPRSYHVGKMTSGGALALVAVVFALSLFRRVRQTSIKATAHL